jgi:hypothetical protein
MDLNAKPASQGGQQTIGVRGKALFTAEIGWWRYVFQHPARAKRLYSKLLDPVITLW